jgi:putative DNA primase/helicase
MQNDQSLAIINALDGDERTGMCFCPAHPDRNTPNLHVKASNDGRVLVHCFRGCSQQDVVTALRQRGLWPSSRRQAEYENRQRDQERKKAAEEEERRRWERAHRILRAASCDQTVLSVVQRYLNNRRIKRVPLSALAITAQQSRELLGLGFPAMVFPIICKGKGVQGAQVTLLSRNGETKLNTEKPRRIYGQLSGGYVVVRELDERRPLIVGEGIETVASACRIAKLPGIAALSATNLPKVTPPPCSEIIIACDNDRAGRDKAKNAAEKWAASGRKVRIAVPEGYGDWNDVLRAVSDPAELREWATAIREDSEVVEAADVGPLSVEAFMELEFPPREFLLKPWLATTSLAMLDALMGHGKTWLALSIGYAVASGEPLLDWEVEKRGRVLYVDGELPGRLLQSRLRQLGPPLSEDAFQILSRPQFELRGLPIPDLGTQEGRDFLDQIIEDGKIDLIILDSISTLVRSGVDNDVESWRAIQDWSLKHRARGRAIIYLHHHGRSGNPRGTSAREIVLDSRIKLTRDESLSTEASETTEARTAFKLEFAKAREFFGADAAPKIAYLSTRSGVIEWQHESLRQNTRERVQELARTGLRPADIARELNITRGRVSQIMGDFRTTELRATEEAVDA